VSGVTTEKYLWQGLTRLLAVYDGSDSLLMRFEYADARMPVATTRSDGTYYLAYDQVGSLRIVADASGNVVKRIEYDSFGNIITDTAPAFEVPFGFAGGDTDLYGYCLGDPVNFVDPYGLFNPDLAGAGAGLAGSGLPQAGIGAALLMCGNPIGAIPLALAAAKAVAGAYMIAAAFGYDFLNILPGMVPKPNPCPGGGGGGLQLPMIGDFPPMPFA
jgi:hypothetical protein